MQDEFGNIPTELTSSVQDADLVKSLTVQCGPVFQEMQDGYTYLMECLRNPERFYVTPSVSA
ncbi:hypothetical protein V1478_002335 [Vespula squamosa]|uniref:Uncharacterized protein n=1 Tax=Vespula squamosa TaxID=30214 RepID=A0ABD2BW14_VESSQ